jgi:hypothetical protein
LDKLPKADIIVDPKQPGDMYPFKEFAACGLSFQLAKALLGKKMSDTLYQSMVELAALGTIADMMPREADNIAIIQEGLDALPYSWRPGIRAFLESDIFGGNVPLEAKVQQMITVLNVRDTKKQEPGAFWPAPRFQKPSAWWTTLLKRTRRGASKLKKQQTKFACAFFIKKRIPLYLKEMLSLNICCWAR